MENMRPSGLKPPSVSGRALLETSQSDLNTRNATVIGSMGPPTVPAKHKLTGCKDTSVHRAAGRAAPGSNSSTATYTHAVPEPAPKRKTLAERAGEPINPLRSHMPPPTKPAGVASRTASSLAGSYRHGSHPTSNGIQQPTRSSAFRHARNQSVQDAAAAAAAEEEAESGVMGKRKGTPILSFNHPLALRKTRTHGNLREQSHTAANLSTRLQQTGHSIRSLSDGGMSSDSEQSSRQVSDSSSASYNSTTQQQATSQATRNSSLVTAFEGLSLTAIQRISSAPKHSPSLESIKEERTSPSKIPKYSCTPSLRHAQSTQALQTPSPLKHKSSMIGLYTPRTTAKRVEPRPFFLTKEKLTPTPAWDTKGRLEDMEQLYAQLRSQMNGATESRNALEESLALYKSRGMSGSRLFRRVLG
jgi:kinesin family member C1